MNHQLRYTAEKIRTRLALARANRFRNRVMLAPFRLAQLADAACPPPLTQPTDHWPELPWNSYWAGPDMHFVLRTSFTRPADWQGPAALWLPIGDEGDIFNHPEALLYLNGTPLGSVDRNHHTIDLPAGLGPGALHQIALHGWTGLFGWPPNADSPQKLFMPPCWVVERSPDLDAFLTTAACALDSADHMDADRPEAQAILTALDAAFVALDTRDPVGAGFHDSAATALAVLREALAGGAPLPGVRLHGIGHAHMDIAYLWPISQIRLKNARTYTNVLRLMERFPDYRFSHSQPALYAMTEEDHPDIFAQIRTRVAEGRWEVMGGMWVEPDANMPGPESLVRQILLGRKYFRDRFGDVETPVLWLPDTFGFPWSLPQLMKQAGLDYFVTNKLNWNQYNQMPSSSFQWQGIDGSRVLAHVLTTPREVQHLPFPTNYKSDLSAREVAGTWENSTAKAQITDLPICYGFGDGGGGPTEDLIRRAQVFGHMPGMPQVTFSTVRRSMEAIAAGAKELPVWNDELYLEGHRGVLTSQAWIKRANRQAEALLHETEALMVMAAPCGASKADRVRLTKAWRLLCLNQFHDILTGSAVTQVFDDARRDFETIRALVAPLRQAALEALSGGRSHRAWCAINTSAFAVSGPVLAPDLTAAETPLPSQDTGDGLLVDLPALPPYTALSVQDAATPQDAEVARAGTDQSGVWIENALIRVEIAPDGALTRIYDKARDRDVLAPGEPGNQLWAFEDRPLNWDAWDIDVFVDDRAEQIGGTESVAITETGPLRASVRVTRCYRASRITQDIQLRRGSARIDFVTDVDWHEQHILLKTAFPVSVLSPRATYDIQWGQIERPTHRNTRSDYAKFEVPAQKWADLSEGGYGVALLNDCKHGYDIRDNVLRLSLIKSSTMPDPGADQGQHLFTYALLPHPGDLPTVRREASALNQPVRFARLEEHPPLPFVTCDAGNVVIETVKPAEDGNGFILRLFEAARQRGKIRLTFAAPLAHVSRVNLLEDAGEDLHIDGASLVLDLAPFEIVSLRCIPASGEDAGGTAGKARRLL
jgi:alpha-mannosidase